MVGNSAGAGLALAACQWLRDRGHRQPSRLMLISPAADASVSRPEQVEIAARDPIQDIPGIIEAGRLYAGELDVGHPFVSPLNGAFRSLAPMTIFSGTRDLLYPDSVDLAERARAAGVPVELHLLRDQPHNYRADADAGRATGACDHFACSGLRGRCDRRHKARRRNGVWRWRCPRGKTRRPPGRFLVFSLLVSVVLRGLRRGP